MDGLRIVDEGSVCHTEEVFDRRMLEFLYLIMYSMSRSRLEPGQMTSAIQEILLEQEYVEAYLAAHREQYITDAMEIGLLDALRNAYSLFVTGGGGEPDYPSEERAGARVTMQSVFQSLLRGTADRNDASRYVVCGMDEATGSDMFVTANTFATRAEAEEHLRDNFSHLSRCRVVALPE